jgi:hypothetical protein
VALSALAAVLATSAIIPSGLIVTLWAMMIAQGVWSLVRAVRVRSWERNWNSELLISSGWRRRLDRDYFVRPAARH